MLPHRLDALLCLGVVVVLAVIVLSSVEALPPPSNNCQRKCGEEVGHGSFRPFLIDVEVLNIWLQQGLAQMRMDTYSQRLLTCLRYMSGCVSMCRRGDVRTLTNGSCSGIGCCQTAIPKGLQYYEVWFAEGFNTHPNSHSPKATLHHRRSTMLIGNGTCDEARNKPESYACVSNSSECFNSDNGQGYICNCAKGFQGSPYLLDGCEDVDECNNNLEKYPCSVKGTCKNTQGGFQCICPPHYPKGNAYRCEKDHLIPLEVTIPIYRIHEEDDECFQQNGGKLLMDMMKVASNKTFKLYNQEEIELATNNFDKNSIIGEGGQGTVYIRQNLDLENNPVAIKICKGFDENRRMEFGKELRILSQVKHENIVQLLGCSLQFEAPVLVYEYVPNQTLQHLIHTQVDPSKRTLEVRLKIASEIAAALAYLHSLSHPVFHGDAKSVNILLGHDLSAKVSDFGCSMIRSADENVQVVQGTMGYLDPEYLLNFELTDKSDVYSFGVVLLELLTRRRALSKTKVSLVSVFMEDREIDNQENMELILQVAAVASRCLAMTGQHRPMMREVAEELQRLASPVPLRTQGFHGVSALMMQGRSSDNSSGDYTSEESTDYYILQKKASMSIEFAR
uniref:Protein kinase domain-containing protein n=1 Tax=Setaria viridis TaxID=4556 RepID=A0A4U6U1B1_SETVI|nr:hypothetical protein SEVIR_7G067700v2 [Setaria viridis]